MEKQSDSSGGYDIRASYRATMYGNIPTLKVIRLSDKRVIFPFQGCPEMPTFPTPKEAVDFANDYGERLVAGDIAFPER